MEWPLQDAKNKFSEVVERALTEGPQLVTRHGKPAVMVVSVEEHLKGQEAAKQNFVDFLLSIPKNGDDEDLFVRVDSPMRDVDL